MLSFAGFTRALGAVIVIVIGAAAASVPAQEFSQEKDFDIPAQSLSKALVQFSDQSGIQVVTAGAEVSRFQTNGVKGHLKIPQALTTLLNGTQLSYRVVGKSTVALVISTAPTSEATRPAPLAAAQPVVADSEEQKSVQLEEVVVTAQKRQERLQDVPASVSAVTATTLNAIGANRMEDYVAMVPGLSLTDNSFTGGATQISIRGITTSSDESPTVGIYVDDAPFGSSTFLGTITVPDLDPMDLTRVEVLRGPQGTLYGAGSMGGLLKYVTSQPDPTQLFGRIQLDGAQVDGGGSGYGVRAAINVPLNSTLALRVSGYDREDPGFINDRATRSNNVNVARFQGGRVALGWQPSDAWTFSLSALLQHQTANECPCVDYSPTTFKPLYGELNQVRAPGTGPSSQTVGIYSLHISGDLGWATLASSSSYSNQKVGFNNDFTGLFGPFLGSIFGVTNGGAGLLENTALDRYTQEIRLSSPESGPLSWRLGAYYDHEHLSIKYHGTTFDATSGQPLGLPSIIEISRVVPFEEFAGFGDLTYRITPQADVTAGVRYSYNRQSQVETDSGRFEGPLSTTYEHSTGNATTYLITPRYHLNDDTMIYARVASGYRPGGPNIVAPGVPSSYGSDSLTNYEIGVKADLLDRRASVDLSAYYIDWKNIQVSEDIGIYTVHANAGDATSKGLEATVSWRPVAALSLSGNASYTVARLGSNLPDGGGSKGEDLPNTPRWSGQLSADYEIPLRNSWRGLVGASYRYIGQRTNQLAAPVWSLPAYEVVDLRIGVKDDRWAVMAYAKNLGDSRGESAATTALGPVARVTIIQPRTFGVSLSHSF